MSSMSLLVARCFVWCFVCMPAFACSYPDEGNLPLRRAVSKVKYRPDTEAWASAMHKQGAVVQYALLLDAPHRERGRCYWSLELRADGKLWRRYYISPDGKSVLREEGAAPQAATRPRAATAAAR
jgi:hypothetical protein